MYSFPSVEQRQQAGAASQASSYYNQSTWRDQPAGSESNSCRYNTVSSGRQRPQGSSVVLHYGGCRQTSAWQVHAGSHQAVLQTTEVNNYSLQAPRANGEKELPNSQMENAGFPTSHRILAHRHYGNMNQGFTDCVSAYTTTTTTSASCHQATHNAAYDMQASQNNQFKQIDARHASLPNVFQSNLATSQRSVNSGNATYLSNGQNSPSSAAHQKAQQYPAELRPACNYGGAGSNATNPVQYVLHKLNEFNDARSHPAANKLELLSRVGSGSKGPPPPYSASGHRVQQPVESPVPHVFVSQDNSTQYLQEQFKRNNLNRGLSNPPRNARTRLLSLLVSKATSAQRIKAGNASPSADNRISRENSAVSFSHSSRMTTPRFTTPTNRNQSPRNLPVAFRTTETPSLVSPGDCSAHAAAAAAAPGTKVIAVVQPLPCESLQVCSNSTSPDTDKECTSTVAKIAAWLREEGANFPDKTSSRSITATGGSEDHSDLSDSNSSPQRSAQESQLDDEKRDAQQSEPSPTLENTKSPKDQEVEEASSPATENVFVLRGEDVYTEQPYKSSWLNVNEQLDDIDKEFGFPWSLKCQYYKHQSDDESDGETSGLVTAGASSPPETETSNRISSQTPLSPQTAEGGEASSPKCESDGATESCYSFKLDVLPPEVAKHIFEEAESLVTLKIDEDNEAGSKLEDDAPDAETMENPSGSIKRVHGASDGTKKTQNHIKFIDLTTNDQPTTIILSDEEEDLFIVEQETSTKLPEPHLNIPEPHLNIPEPHLNIPEPHKNIPEPHLNIPEPHLNIPEPYKNIPEPHLNIPEPHLNIPEPHLNIPEPHLNMPEPHLNIPEPQELCAAPVQIKAWESADTPTNREDDSQAGCEQSLVKPADVNEACLDLQVPVSGPEDPSSNDCFEIQKSKKCKRSDVDSQRALQRFSRPDETFVGAPAAAPSRPVKQAVQLALYGSAQKRGLVDEPPAFLLVFLSPLKRKSTEDVCIVNKPVKQRILEKWRESLQPVKIKRRKKSSAESLKNGNRAGSSEKTWTVDQRDESLKRRSVVKKHPKKYVVTVKESDDCGRSEPKDEKRDPSAVPENVILKFTVLPETFDLKERSETKEGPPAAQSAGREFSVKKPVERKRHSEDIDKAKVAWNMDHSNLLSRPAFPKKSDLFQEFQKKHKKKTSSVSR